MKTNIQLIQADITTIDVDVIVNAANSSLLGGGGVDGAINRKGGKTILDECIAIRNKQGGCATGEAVITTGGNLPAKYVIHTVGPVWQGGNKNEAPLLEDCYTNSLRLAIENKLSSIAFPEQAAMIAIQTAKNFPEGHQFEKVLFVCFDEENFLIYKRILED